VEAALRTDIRSDVLVARQTELRLPGAIAAIMATRAVLFVLRVRCGELAWHEQRLGIDRFNAWRNEQAEQCRECPFEPT